MDQMQVLTITPDALDMIIKLRDQEPGEEEFALSIEVAGVRGLQYAYDLAFVPLSDQGEDWLLERHGDLAVIFPARDVEKLDGATLELTDSGLAMNNPNTPASPFSGAVDVPGSLEGPLAERVAGFLQNAINPAIAAHGGAAELVSVDGTTAYLRLMGGCQGCGLAAVTLRQGIEQALLDAFEGEITGVVDVTDHEAGANPYYAHSH
ncbi:MAG TPA: NifU family protein [Acidimicrobiia bacterium]|jgi:Fe/S biogenesis protein NfuA